MFVAFSVTEDEANAFGNFLVQEGFFDEGEGALLLRRSGETLVVHVAVKEGVAGNAKAEEMFQRLGREVSRQVFRGNPVDVHLCDAEFETLKVIR